LEYLCCFIENKTVDKVKPKQKFANNNFEPSLHKTIDEQYSNNETHRGFFKKVIGEHFKFNVRFMNWMEEHKGKKTYQDAVEIYHHIAAEKKSGKQTVIGKQFEYNQYTRDFFADNPMLTKEDCIKCWNYAKQKIGKHVYEKEDLIALGKSL
jgi:hypothetical protein